MASQSMVRDLPYRHRLSNKDASPLCYSIDNFSLLVSASIAAQLKVAAIAYFGTCTSLIGRTR